MRLLVLLFVFLMAHSGRAQERVRNVRVRVVDSSLLEIRYDLLTARPGDSVYLDVRSRLRGSLRIGPEFVRGDLGKRITAGSERRIVWDALANGYRLNEEIQAVVRVKTGLPPAPAEPTIAQLPPAPAETKPIPKPISDAPTPTNPPPSRRREPAIQPAEPALTPAPTERKTRYVGPAWALLSALAPGVGNIFVQTPRPKIGLRPLVTVGSYGLLVYGLLERQKSRDDYAQYEQQKNKTAGEPYYQTANDHHHRYYGATRAAMAVAAADVILTVIRGVRNGQLPREVRSAGAALLRPGLQAGQPTAVFQYSF